MTVTVKEIRRLPAGLDPVRPGAARALRGVLPYLKVGKVVLFHWPDVVDFLKGNFRVCRRAITK